MSDKVDDAIAAADSALPPEPEPGTSMVAQAQLVRNGAIIRVVVPRDFTDADVSAVMEMTLQLLRAANEIRAAMAHGGLLVPPPRPPLVSIDGKKLS